MYSTTATCTFITLLFFVTLSKSKVHVRIYIICNIYDLIIIERALLSLSIWYNSKTHALTLCVLRSSFFFFFFFFCCVSRAREKKCQRPDNFGNSSTWLLWSMVLTFGAAMCYFAIEVTRPNGMMVPLFLSISVAWTKGVIVVVF